MTRYLNNHNVWVKVYYSLFTSVFWHLNRNFLICSLIPQGKKEKGNYFNLLAVFMCVGQKYGKINYGKDKLLGVVIICSQILPFLLPIRVRGRPERGGKSCWWRCHSVLATLKKSVGANAHSILLWQRLVRLDHTIYKKKKSLHSK